MPGMTFCEPHGLPVYSDGEWHPGTCPTCYKWRGQCDFGGCPRPGGVRVSALGPSEPAPEGSRDGGRVRRILETRRVCSDHVRDVVRGYHAAGVELCWVDGPNSGPRPTVGPPCRECGRIHPSDAARQLHRFDRTRPAEWAAAIPGAPARSSRAAAVADWCEAMREGVTACQQ